MRFTQVKMNSSDPEALSLFYQEALDCDVLLPLTTLAEPASVGVGESGGDVQILVLSLPGSDVTLELITAGLAGRGFLTFLVEDVATSAQRVVDAGGAFHGEIVEFETPSGSTARFVFMTDPEGNVIDLFARL